MTLQHPSRSRRSILQFLIVLTFGLAAANAARATTTYSYSGPHSLTWTTNSTKYLFIERTGGYDSLTVFASLTGSSNFTPQMNSVMWPDTVDDTNWQYDTARYFMVSFSSSIADTSYAKLVLYDNDHTHSDTISLVGYGTDDRVDYTLRWLTGTWDTTGGGSMFATLTFNPDSGTNVSLDGIISNHRTTPIDVIISVSDSTYWNVDYKGMSEDLSLNGTSDHTFGEVFAINYTPHGVYRDSVMVTISCSSPYSQTTTFWIYATDPRYKPHDYSPEIRVPDFAVTFGDTACGSGAILDTTSQPITITSITKSSQSGWSLNGLPSLPLTLAPGDSVNFSVCFSGGNYPSSDVGITVAYTDTSGLKGTVLGVSYADYTEECIQPLRSYNDTLKLDEVIYGGYVEASASFIMHLDTVLRAGSGVMYAGGSIQIISPSLPMQVHAGDTVTIVFRVTPPAMDSTIYGLGLYFGYIPLYLGGCNNELSFEGTVTDTTTSDLQLFEDQTGLLALTTTNTTIVDTFWFDNNDSEQVIVSSVALSNGSNFQLLGELPHAPADTLTPGNEMGVIVQFDGDTNGFYHDSLSVTTVVSRTEGKHEIMSSPTSVHLFNLEAIRTQGSAGVNEPVAISPASISIVPNPASGPVTVSLTNAAKVEIEIFDLLGNPVMATQTVSGASFEWNAATVPNGTYFVRASGVDASGAPFVISKQMMLNK